MLYCIDIADSSMEYTTFTNSYSVVCDAEVLLLGMSSISTSDSEGSSTCTTSDGFYKCIQLMMKTDY